MEPLQQSEPDRTIYNEKNRDDQVQEARHDQDEHTRKQRQDRRDMGDGDVHEFSFPWGGGESRRDHSGLGSAGRDALGTREFPASRKQPENAANAARVFRNIAETHALATGRAIGASRKPSRRSCPCGTEFLLLQSSRPRSARPLRRRRKGASPWDAGPSSSRAGRPLRRRPKAASPWDARPSSSRSARPLRSSSGRLSATMSSNNACRLSAFRIAWWSVPPYLKAVSPIMTCRNVSAPPPTATPS